MNRFLIAAAIMTVSVNAHASDSRSSAAAAAGAASSSVSVSSVNNRVTNKQSQGQIQGQVQNATAGGGNASSGPVSVGGDRTVIAPALGGFASGPCVGAGFQASLGLVGGGGGLGVSTVDQECTRRESARILHLLGHTELAVKLMMQSPMIREITEQKAETSEYCRRNPSDYYCKN